MTDYSRLATENFQQLNLSRVIQIVRGDAADVLRVGPARPPAARADARRGQAAMTYRSSRCCSLSSATSRRQARASVTAGRAGQLLPARGNESVASRASRRRTMYFQLGGVEHDLPDVVTPPARPPQRPLRPEAAERAPQRRAVPGLTIEGLVVNGEQQRDAGVAGHRDSVGSLSVIRHP